jgi:hypothetical protein
VKCTVCKNENSAEATFCAICGASINVSASGKTQTRHDANSRVLIAIKVWITGGLTGLGTSLSFILAHNLLTTDHMFSLWEFSIASITPALIGVFASLATKLSPLILLVVSYMTLLMPVLGGFFGSSGSEPLWQFAILGLIGGLVWSIPFALWRLKR